MQLQCAVVRECRGVRLGPEPMRLWVLALQPPQCKQMVRGVTLWPQAFAQGVPSRCMCVWSVHMPAQSVCVGEVGEVSRVTKFLLPLRWWDGLGQRLKMGWLLKMLVHVGVVLGVGRAGCVESVRLLMASSCFFMVLLKVRCIALKCVRV